MTTIENPALTEYEFSTHIYADGHVRLDECAIANESIASRLIFVQEIHVAHRVIPAAMLSRVQVVRASAGTRTVSIEIRLILDIALDEVGDFRVRFGFGEIVANPNFARVILHDLLHIEFEGMIL